MKRRRYDSDSDESDGHAEEPLLQYAAEDKNEVLMEMGLGLEVVGEESVSDGNSVKIATTNDEDEQTLEVSGVCPAEAALCRQDRDRCLQRAARLTDRDVPDSWKDLFTEELLQVYHTTLSYTECGRSLDDKLMTQYIPYDVEQYPPLCRMEERVWENAAGIRPGWRWDGVVRGIDPAGK
ncbi:hypothetical protein ERJ75_000218700 [Trypanosoma vivax]|nr:hypothetical protein TRVL_01030 [Trypanosoma vivax]KAH8619144.1 hypothetical protein ERJ75_000218700 [Trypanosoma vivax]